MLLILKVLFYMVLGHVLYIHNIRPDNKLMDFLTILSSTLIIDVISYYVGYFSDREVKK